MCNTSFILAKAVCWEPLWAGHSDWKRLYLSPVSGEKPRVERFTCDDGSMMPALHRVWRSRVRGWAGTRGRMFRRGKWVCRCWGRREAALQGPWQHKQDTVMMHTHYRTHTWAWCWGCLLTLSCPRTAQLSGRLTPPESHSSLMCSQAGAPSALRGKQWEFFPLKKNKHRKKALKCSTSNGHYCML